MARQAPTVTSKTRGCSASFTIRCSLFFLLTNLDQAHAFSPTSKTWVSASIPAKQHPFVGASGRSAARNNFLTLRSSSSRRGASASSRRNKKNQNWLARAASSFLTLLWRGMTLPFPMLRDADRSSTGSSFFSLRESLFAIVAYLALGSVAYTRIFEHWSLVDALYFSVVSFSTVGYGDLCPTNLPSKIFTCFFGLGGIAFLGVAIATIGTSLIEAELEAVQMAQSASKRRLVSFFEGMPDALTLFKSGKGVVPEKEEATSDESILDIMQEEEAPPTIDPNAPAPKWFLRKTMLKVVPKFIPSVALLLVGGTIMGRVEGWSWHNSMYYSVVTAGTLGYGDFAPVTRIGRMWGICFIPIAVAAAGEFLGNIANLMVERRQVARNEELMNRELDMNYLTEMDKNGSGVVDRTEYVTFMLKAMGVVEQDLLDELHEQFDRLDVSNSGNLGKDDLRLMAELRGVQAKV